jgi:hypothetical protein
VFIPFDEQGRAPMPEARLDGTSYPFTVVFGGGTADAHQDGIWGWSLVSVPGGVAPPGEEPVRPVGVAISPVDGALYVSSDNASVLGGQASVQQGAIYRIGLDRSAGY